MKYRPMLCPVCGYYFRRIDVELGLYECSNKKCNVIIQHLQQKVIKEKIDLETDISIFQQMLEK